MSASEYIVISDMHISLRSRKERVEGFCGFLDSFAGRSGKDGRFTLIIAGDFFNFDLLELDIGAPGDPDPRKILMKILGRFPRIAESMARFLAAGNGISLLGGNHDLEMFHPDVAELFKSIVLRHMREDSRSLIRNFDISDPEYIRIGGNVHIEHGNRFDRDNSFEKESVQKIKRGEKPLFPLGSCMERNFLSRVPQLDYDGFSIHTPWPLFTTILKRHGVAGGLNIIFRYIVTSFGLIFESVKRRTDRQWKRVMDSFFTLNSPLRTVRRLYIDRILAFILLIIWFLIFPFIFFRARALWFTVLGLLVVFFIAGFIEGNRYNVSIFQACRMGARSIMASSESIRTVILGHTHKPEVLSIDGGSSYYLNAGSFLTPTPLGLPYIIVFETGQGHRAELKFFKPWFAQK